MKHNTIKNQRKAGVLVDHENREKDDYYNTPAEAVFALLDRESFSPVTWEPACGEGHVSEALVARGHSVTSSDLVDRGYGEPRVDFLMEYGRKYPNIITNPPFKLAVEFILHALACTTEKVAMFLPLSYLTSKDRKIKLWDKTPLKKVYIFSYRVDSNKNGIKKKDSGSGVMNFAWFVWEHGHSGPPTIEWIGRPEWD